VSEDNTGPTDAASDDHVTIPRLSIGQRVLTALPNLQRPPKPPPVRAPRAGAGPKGAGVGTGARAGSDVAVNAAATAGPGADGAGNDDSVTPDAVLEPGSGTPGAGRGSLRDSFFKPATPPQPRGAPSGMTKEELVTIIKRLDDRERVIALFSGFLAIAVGVLLTVALLHTNPPLHHKGHQSAGMIVYFDGGVRLLLSLVVLAAVWSRRRSFVAFALLFLGTAMGFPFALPFWALGVWLIFRVFKWQKELTAMTRGTTRGRDASPRRSAPPR
jgi:hypothetical protein